MCTGLYAYAVEWCAAIVLSCTRADLGLVLPAIGCCILLLLVPKMVLTLCNFNWWWYLSCHQLVQRPHLHLQWTSLATCASGGFLVPTSPPQFPRHAQAKSLRPVRLQVPPLAHGAASQGSPTGEKREICMLNKRGI